MTTDRDAQSMRLTAVRDEMSTIPERCLQPYWFGRPEAEVRAAVDARAEAWAAVPGYSRYEWSDKGRLRRLRDGYIMKTSKLNNSGYVIPNLVRDSDGKQVTVAAAPMVLLAHHPAFRGLDKFPDGLETRHNPAVGDKTFNAYPEGIWPGTRIENEADKPASSTPPEPTFPCRNAPVCVNFVVNEGRRCPSCVAAVGCEAAALLRLGMPLQQVAERFGYTGPDWVYQLAVKHGGYEGGKAGARTQRPRLGQRLRLSARLARGSDAL